MQFLIAIFIVFGGYWVIRQFAKATPNQAKGRSKKMAGGALMAVSGFFALTGRYQVAAPLFAVGLGLFGYSSQFPDGFGFKRRDAGAGHAAA